MKLHPIPVDLRESNLEAVPIIECGDALGTLSAEDRIFVQPEYCRRGFATARNKVELRTQVISALRRAANKLPDGVNFLIWDGLRTLETQAEIAARFEATLGDLPDEDREAVLSNFVAPIPETEEMFRTFPTPHSTGGAVDLTLCDDTGHPLDLGADFDEFSSVAALGYFEHDDHLDGPRSILVRQNRRLLFTVMTDAGFAPLASEFWHYEFGTQRAASFWDARVARFGPVVAWWGKSHAAE